MKPEKRVTAAVEKAQEILAQYIEPGPRNCETTINELMDVLDDNQLIVTGMRPPPRGRANDLRYILA